MKTQNISLLSAQILMVTALSANPEDVIVQYADDPNEAVAVVRGDLVVEDNESTVEIVEGNLYVDGFSSFTDVDITDDLVVGTINLGWEVVLQSDAITPDSSFPTPGIRQVFIGGGNASLMTVRIFAKDGSFQDWTESDFVGNAGALADLKSYLSSRWDQSDLTVAETQSIVSQVATLTGHAPLKSVLNLKGGLSLANDLVIDAGQKIVFGTDATSLESVSTSTLHFTGTVLVDRQGDILMGEFGIAE